MNPLPAAIFVAHGTALFAFGAAILMLMRGSAAASRRLVCVLTLAGACIAPLLALFAPPWLTVGQMAAPLALRVAAVAQVGNGAGAAGDWTSFLIVLWAMVVFGLLARTVAGWATIWLEWRSAAAVGNGEWRADARRVAGQLRLRAVPDLRFAQVASPIVWAAARPILLLPAAAVEWDADRRRIVLLHEFAHLMRFDPWVNCLAQVVRAVFWFHPLAWYMTARLAREEELACDDEVLRAGVRGPDYAHVLIDAVRRLRSAALFGCAMTGSPAHRMLRDRVEHMLDERRNRMGNARRHALVLAAFAAMLLMIGALRPVWSQNGKVYKIGNGVSAPQLVHKVEPAYTQDARDNHIEGAVVLHVVITDEGEPTEITVTRHLDPGLDENAVSAVKQWRFKPGMKDNQPVAVQAQIEVNFRLK